MFMRSAILATTAALAVTASAFADHHETSGFDTFESALAAHIEAVTNRDIDVYVASITTGENLTIIFPGGEIMRSRDEAIEFHTEWFATPGWTMTFEIDHLIETENMGVASLRATYTDDGGPRVNWLTLVFEEQDGDWRLVFDQNTRNPPREPEGEAE